MPTNSQPTSPLSRLFRPDPHRELFRILADSLADGVLVLSLDGASVLSCNHAFLLLSGFSRSEAEALAPIDLFPGEPGEQVLAALTAEWSAPDLRIDSAALKTHQGEIATVDISASLVGSPRYAILMRLRPSIERRRTQEREASEADRLHRLADLTSALIDREGPAIARALAVARPVLRADALAVYRVSAADRNYVLDGALADAFPPALSPEEVDPLSKPGLWNLGTRPDHPLHKAARSAGWTVLRTAPLGAPSAWIGVLVAGWAAADAVPAEAETLLALAGNVVQASLVLGLQQAAMADAQSLTYQSEAEVNALLAGLGEGVLTLDRNLRVERASRSAATQLGYEPTELAGQVIQDVLVGPKDVRPLLLDALGHDVPLEEPALTLHRRDGTSFPAYLRVLPMGAAGQNPRLLLILGDRTEHQAIETRNEVLTQRALLGEVTAIFAHEVRNPINNISTGVQLVSSRLGAEHPLHDALERIRKECTRLDQLMSDVLFFARPLELKMEPVDLAEMMRRLVERWKPRLAQAKVHAHTAFESAAGRVLADPRTLEQVVVNLLSNALQAMAEGGTLSITVAPSPDTQTVELKVADTGPGIPAEIRERIFDPFFTTKKDGTGLGLAISRRIVTAHKGTLHVESFAGAGTVFTIRLPRNLESEEAG